MIPSTRSMMKAARRNDRLVDMTFARSLDDFKFTFNGPEQPKTDDYPIEDEIKDLQRETETMVRKHGDKFYMKPIIEKHNRSYGYLTTPEERRDALKKFLTDMRVAHDDAVYKWESRR